MRVVLEEPFKRLYSKPGFLDPFSHPLPDIPYYFEVEITNNCNSACIMCARNNQFRKIVNIDLNLYDKFLSEIEGKETGVRWCGFGEPTLHPRFFELVAATKKRNIMLHVLSNGLRGDREFFEQVVESGIDEYRFSLQGIDKKTYQFYRRNNEYDRLLQNIELLKKIRDRRHSKYPYIIVCTTTYGKEEKAGEVEFNRFWSARVDKVEFGNTTFVWVKDSNTEGVEELYEKELKPKKHTPCVEIFLKGFINSRGDYLVCCIDFTGYWSIGNIRDITVHEMWHSNTMNNLREMLGPKGMKHDLFPFCRNCFSLTKKFERYK